MSIIKSIHVVIDASSIYGAVVTDDLDVQASTARYAALVQARIEANYPGVDIDVSTVPVANRNQIVIEYDDAYASVAMAGDLDNDDIDSVQQTLSTVHTRGDWVVPQETTAHYTITDDRLAEIATAVDLDTDTTRGILCADWREGAEHQAWLDTASVAEIADWVREIATAESES